MGLLDRFRKKRPDEGTYHRDRSRETGQGYEDAAYEDAAYQGDSFFRIKVEDVFTITGRGTVITGKVECGFVRIGDTVTLRRTDGSSREVTIAGIEMFRKMLDVAEQGDNVGLLLRGLTKSDIGRGDILERQ